MIMFQLLRKWFGGSSGAKSASNARFQATRLELETLDERVLPSTLPFLVGSTFYFTNGNSLKITSEPNLNSSQSSFTGYFRDPVHSVSTNVSGVISLNYISSGYSDFSLSYSGQSTFLSGAVNEGVTGSGDFKAIGFNGNSFSPASSFSGWDYDYCVIRGILPFTLVSEGLNSDFGYTNKVL
jgi:hypothetical protein